jgi:hypothetical protein
MAATIQNLTSGILSYPAKIANRPGLEIALPGLVLIDYLRLN